MVSRLPTVEECAGSDDPSVKHQWALIALPFHGSTPYTIEEALRPQWSKHFDDLGFVWAPGLAGLADKDGNIHVSQLPEQKLKFRAPFRGQQHSLNGLSAWVPVDDPDPDPVVLPDMSAFTRHEQEVVAEQLRYHGVINEAAPKRDVAAVSTGPLFDPSEHTPSTVNGYLMGADVFETRRVVAAEMAGKARDQILRKHRGV